MKLKHDNHESNNNDRWTDGLICAFELVHGYRKVKTAQLVAKELVKKTSFVLYDQNGWSSEKVGENSICDLLEVESLVIDNCPSDNFSSREGLPRIVNCWRPIGWARVSELVQTVQCIGNWSLQSVDFIDGEDGIAVTDMSTPYWERPVGPTWWCHVDDSHPYINSWLSSAHWLRPAINLALRDEHRLISDRMKHLV